MDKYNDCNNIKDYEPDYPYDPCLYSFSADTVQVNNGDSWETWTKENFIACEGWWYDEEQGVINFEEY